MDHEFWEEVLAEPPINGADALCGQVAGLLDGDSVAWVKRINRTGFLAVSEFLALVLYKVREIENPARSEEKAILDWARMVRKAIEQEQIIGLDPDSHTPISLRNEEAWNWETSLHYADLFLKQCGTGWCCAQIIRKLLLSQKEKPTRDASKGDFMELLALFATAEKYGYDATKRNSAISRMQTDLLTRGVELHNHTIRIYVRQSVNGKASGLTIITLQKLVTGLAIALYKYDAQSPEESLLKIKKDHQERGVGNLQSGKIPELLELASQKNPRNPHKI